MDVVLIDDHWRRSGMYSWKVRHQTERQVCDPGVVCNHQAGEDSQEKRSQ